MKKIICTLLTMTIIITAFALPCNAKFTQKNVDGKDFAPAVENQGGEEDCMYYAILSTAGSYAKKYYSVSNETADFSEIRLKNKVGITDVHNFGEILYKCTECSIGHSFAITSFELLNGRGRRYLQEKIAENGAIVAAIAIPESADDMYDEKYYDSEKYNFSCSSDELSNTKSHAISIVGWDDNYNRKDFKYCKRNGAWLCKNSYGTDYGDGGYFWLPYEYGFLYSAALEVTRTDWFDTIYKANELPRDEGYVYAVNVRAFSNVTEPVTVKIGETVAFSGEVNLKNGSNFIKFDKLINADKITVSAEDISVRADTVLCYVSPINVNFTDSRKSVNDEEWLEEVKYVNISIESDDYWTTGENELGRTVNHNIIYNSIDNCYYITPDDGYYFTEDTLINSMYGFDDGYDIFDWYDYYGEEFVWFRHDEEGEYIENFTIGMAVDANYHRLKNDKNEWIKMISFDEGVDGRGRLKIVGSGIGGGKVESVNIVTDENSLPKYIILGFENGSEFKLKNDSNALDIAYYSDKDFKNKIESVSGLNEYYLMINSYFVFEEDYDVFVNGVRAENEIEYKLEIEFGIKIEIPDIELKGKEKEGLFYTILNIILGWFL